MADPLAIADIAEALRRRDFPTTVLLNRLEARPRTHDFERSLAVEVRDALWMLTRQWQLGELRGDDAGSPLTVQLHVDRQPLTRLKRSSPGVEPLDPSIPLEASVERRPLPMTRIDEVHSLDLRLMLGRQWLQMISDIGSYADAFIAAYPIVRPDPSRLEHASLCAHLEVWQAFAAVAGRRLDGWRLYQHLLEGSAHPYDGVAGVALSDRNALDERAVEFRQWVRALIHAPSTEQDDAWMPDRLEFRFECAAGSETGEEVFIADEYRGGSMDWYALDAEPSRHSLSAHSPPTPVVAQVIRQATLPVQVTFQGMPSTRWWELEDGRTNFGQVRADTTDLAKLLLCEFGLVYGNDWFVIPCTLPVGSLATLGGLVVTDVFGDRTWIDPVDHEARDSWRRFSLFGVTPRGANAGANARKLLLLPTVPTVQDGGVREEVVLARDEIANMVWGIERTVSLASGTSVPGAAAARELHTWYERRLQQRLALNPDDRRIVPPSAPVRYRVVTSVAEEWIPFITVRVPGDTRQTQLQRGAMPRILDGDPDAPAKVRPRTALLRVGLDGSPKRSYFVHEEEVSRSGVHLTRRFRRARGRHGRVTVWLSTQRLTGKGESSSGLAFDVLTDQAAR